MSPYSPTFRYASLLPLIEVEMKTSSPQTIGLDRPRPGIGVFQTMLAPVAAFHVAGSENPSAMPLAAMPRNCGQSTPGLGAAGAPVTTMPANITAVADNTTRCMTDLRGDITICPLSSSQ